MVAIGRLGERSVSKDHHIGRFVLIGAAALAVVAGSVLAYNDLVAPAIHHLTTPSTPGGFPAGGPDYHGPKSA